MKRLALTVLLLAGITAIHAEDYTLGSDSQPQDGVPKGTITKFVLARGKYYPGTPHNCALYVPAQYDAGKPTPFMIFLDGSGALGNGVRVPVVFDNLIAKHEIPPMIGIFIDPGVLPVESDQDQNRYNRIYEYDSLTPRFAEFLIHELIPEVARNYNLSKNPDDRGLYGVSTGAVGAFMAAWNRPDQFHRVLSFIGTYVSMKGADSLPALVRKTEPKPIRIFMQDGTNDHIVPGQPYGISFAGSWPMANRVMDEALEFSGYDVKFVMGTEAHNMKQGGAILPDALRWLWRGYPEPITVRDPATTHAAGWDPAGTVYSTIEWDKSWQQVGDSYQDIQNLTSDRDGNVYFVNDADKRIDRVDSAGRVTLFASPGEPIGALHVGPDSRLYGQGSTGIVSWCTDRNAPDQEETAFKGTASPDFAFTRAGAIYRINDDSIERIEASGQIHKGKQLADAVPELGAAGKITLSPDQSLAVVTDWASRYAWSFQIAKDGTLENGEPFYRLELPEATNLSFRTYAVRDVAEDVNGMVYFATLLGVQICMENGRVQQILNLPMPGGGPLTAMTFAATGDQNWLYVAQDGKLFRRPVKVAGANAWTIVKPPKPTL